MAQKSLKLHSAITCHAWSPDNGALALSPNNNEIQLYRKQGSKLSLATTLVEHGGTVMGLDWGASNRIVSCGQDRNAYVWELKGGKWEPTLVILRINRAATTCKWSPSDKKFAVTSGAKCISVCYYESENNWWISKHIKKNIKSTVLAVDWFPDSSVLVAGSSDYKCRIFTAAIKGVDKKPSPTCWGGRPAFGDCCAEFDFGSGWVHDVAFSPSGEKVAFVSHDSSLTIVEGAGNVSQLKTKYLPYQGVIFLTENTVVAGGFDCEPHVYSGADGGAWDFVASCDQKKEAKKAATSATSAAFNKFKQADKLGASGGAAVATSLKTTHQNAITRIKPMSAFPVTSFSTQGLDGQIVVWPVKNLESAIASLKIM